MEDNKQILETVFKEYESDNNTKLLPVMDKDVDLCERYHQAKLKQLAPSDEEMSKMFCNRLRKFYLNEVEQNNPALDDYFILNRYSDQWAIAMDSAKWMRDQFIKPKE